MSNNISIILASISFVGSIISVALTSWLTYLTDQRKRHRESEQLISKYRDPLLLAAQDLQSRLCNIMDWNITTYLAGTRREREIYLIYTAYVVGQYLCWTHILRRQLQFLRFSTDKANKQLDRALRDIVEDFSTDRAGDIESPFMLWRGEQMAIGQRMMQSDNGELYAMGYADFYKRCIEDLGSSEDFTSPSNSEPKGDFGTWVYPIIKGAVEIAMARSEGLRPVPDGRVRRLQHRVIDLMQILDPMGLRSEAMMVQLAMPASDCRCSSCKAPRPSAKV